MHTLDPYLIRLYDLLGPWWFDITVMMLVLLPLMSVYYFCWVFYRYRRKIHPIWYVDRSKGSAYSNGEFFVWMFFLMAGIGSALVIIERVETSYEHNSPQKNAKMANNPKLIVAAVKMVESAGVKIVLLDNMPKDLFFAMTNIRQDLKRVKKSGSLLDSTGDSFF